MLRMQFACGLHFDNIQIGFARVPMSFRGRACADRLLAQACARVEGRKYMCGSVDLTERCLDFVARACVIPGPRLRGPVIITGVCVYSYV